MWSRKPRNQPDTPAFPGEPHALDGHTAAWTIERAASDVVVVPSTAEFTEITGPLSRLSPVAGRETDVPAVLHETTDVRHLAGTLSGFALEGMRTSGFTSTIGAIREGLSAAAGRGLTFIVNLTCRAGRRQMASLHGGHGDYHAAADTGVFQFFAANVQEVADLSIIAHRVAEVSLTPGICAQDFYGTSHSVQNLLLPERELIAHYIGRSGDSIASPTAAQALLFGEERRRIPVLLDPDRPAGIGGVQDRESYFRAVTAQDRFFAAHVAEVIDTSMREFAELTGRAYGRLSTYRASDADVVVVAQGSIVESLRAVVDHVRQHEHIKAGVVSVTAFRPFPGPDIARALKGKGAVTVLERTVSALAEDAPLLQEIRCALDRASENGTAGAGLEPYPEYAPYDRRGDRPPLFSGCYGVGSPLPDFAELVSVFRNMRASKGARRRFYVGAAAGGDMRRFPHLQSLEQRLDEAYPRSGRDVLPVADPAPGQDRAGGAVELDSLSIQGGLFAGNLFAQALGGALKWSVRTFPAGGLDPSLQPSSITIAYDREHGRPRSRPELVDALLVVGEQRIEAAASRRALKRGGTLIASSVRPPEAVWRGLSNRAARWIQEESLDFHVIDARKIAVETASQPSFVDQLAVWALFGAWSKTRDGLTAGELAGLIDGLRPRLARLMGSQGDLVDEITRSVERGASELKAVAWKAWGASRRTATEPEPPWTIREGAGVDGTMFDAGRFWRSVGYLYDTGQDREALADPYIAAGILPAGTSAFRNMAPYRLRVPKWLPENCTGCGACWAQCPETALPPTIQSLSSIVNAAIAECERTGTAAVQMKRVSEHLAKQAYRIVGSDGLRRHANAGALLRAAFEQIAQKMNLGGERLDALSAEFDRVEAVVADLAIAAPDTFFADSDKREPGSGWLLSIAVNPMSCTACGICIEECPEGALEWADQTEERLASYRRAWAFQMRLPPVPDVVLARHVVDAAPETAVHRMLDPGVYQAMVGGDVSFPGNGAKTAIHLLTAAVESVMRPRYRAHIERLSQLIERLENKIQGEVQASVKINDFERFGRRLNELKRDDLGAAALDRLLGSAEEERGLDPARLARLTDLRIALEAQRRRYVDDAGCLGRARMVLVLDPQGAVFWSGTYPYNPHPHPWVAHLPGDAPALARGVFEGIASRLAGELAACRLAEIELDDAGDHDGRDGLHERADWRDLNDEERGLLPPVIIVGQRGFVGWERVSALLSMGYPVKVAIIDSRGLQVPEPAAAGPGIPTRRRSTVEEPGSPPFDMLARHGAFILRATTGYPGHLIRGVVRGVSRRGPALFHIYATDPQTSRVAPEHTAGQARLACRSRVAPLVELDPDGPAPRVVLDGNPEPNSDWTPYELSVEAPSGEASTVETLLTPAHWAFHEGRFRGHFRVVSKGHRSDGMKPLLEFIKLSAEERETVEPYIDVADRARRHVLAVVSPEMVRATEEAAAAWEELRARAAGPPVGGRRGAELEPPSPPAEVPARPGTDREAYEKLTERLLWLCGYGQDPDFFRRSLREFVARDNAAGLEE